MDELLPLLQCPYCGGDFRYEERAAGFGLLICTCDRWPVVDHIPILQRRPIGAYEHTQGSALSPGVPHTSIRQLIERGQYDDALLACLSYRVALPHLAQLSWRLGQTVGAFLGRARVRRLLTRRENLNARAVLSAFFCADSPLGSEVGNYFTFRVDQPRHLAALTLLEQLPQDPRPVADLGCGAGHFEHYLHASGRRAIGINLNFSELWIARHWIAPHSAFICADLRDGLPFTTDALGAVFCSDAYHYVADRAPLLRDIRRCAPARMCILTRVGNQALMPNEGSELGLAGYLAELGECHVFHEFGLLHDYLGRRGPRDRREEAAEHKWLSFVMNAPPFRDRPQWPHGVGRLALNPIYAVSRQNGTVNLRFQFPGVWYAYENAQMLEYHPRVVQLTEKEVEALSNPDSPTAQLLLRQFVAIGVPDRF